MNHPSDPRGRTSDTPEVKPETDHGDRLLDTLDTGLNILHSGVRTIQWLFFGPLILFAGYMLVSIIVMKQVDRFQEHLGWGKHSPTRRGEAPAGIYLRDEAHAFSAGQAAALEDKLTTIRRTIRREVLVVTDGAKRFNHSSAQQVFKDELGNVRTRKDAIIILMSTLDERTFVLVNSTSSVPEETVDEMTAAAHQRWARDGIYSAAQATLDALIEAENR